MPSSSKASKVQANRLPAPALFVGPPSHNASNTSLSADARSPTKAPLARQRSHLAQEQPLPAGNNSYDGDHLSITSSNTSAPFVRRQRLQNQAADAEASSKAEAIWAEMQNTLEEVELSAIKSPGMAVFGSEHSHALDELRRAQIELAKAWAHSADGEASEPQRKLSNVGSSSLSQPSMSPKPRGNSSSKEDKAFDRGKLEEETEKDIELSKKRREENDRYFEKVNKGVQEVVVRLEEVARAMKGVESESQEIWGHGDNASVGGGSVRTAPSIT